MLCSFVLAAAAALPFGVWPTETGDALAVVQDVEFYTVEPEDDFSTLAVLPLAPAVKRTDAKELRRLAALAGKLGADAVLLLGEMPESAIPDDPDDPLPSTDRFAAAAFLVFDQAEGWQGQKPMTGLLRPCYRGAPLRRVGSLDGERGRLTAGP